MSDKLDRRMVTPDFFLEVSKGMVPDYRLFTTPGFHKAGVETVQLGDLSLIPSIVVFPSLSAGTQMQVISSDTQDILGGTGLNRLAIHYLDSNYDEQEEVITMAGLTSANTVATNILKVQQMHAQTVGSNTVAVGDIDLRGISGTPIHERIDAGGNQSLSARYTIPRGYTGYLPSWHCSGTKKRITFYLRATVDRETRILLPGLFHFQDFELCELSNSGTLDLPFLKCPEMSEIKMSAQAEAGGGEAGGAFTTLLIKN